jgi:hypothetical protein
MKKYMHLILLLIPALSFANTSDLDNETKITPETQIGIYTYKSTLIEKYSGVFVSGVVYGKSLGFSVVREKGKKEETGKFNIDQKTLFAVSTDANTGQINSVNKFLNGFASFTQSKIVQSDDFNKDKKITKFDYLDSNGKVRFSLWFDPDSGFMVKRAIFDESGKLVSFKIYLKLDMGDQGIQNNDDGDERFERWADFCKNRIDINLYSIDGVEKLLEESDEVSR